MPRGTNTNAGKISLRSVLSARKQFLFELTLIWFALWIACRLRLVTRAQRSIFDGNFVKPDDIFEGDVCVDNVIPLLFILFKHTLGLCSSQSEPLVFVNPNPNCKMSISIAFARKFSADDISALYFGYLRAHS
jgi:hypothetical protein